VINVTWIMMIESLGVGGRHGLFIMSGTTKVYDGSQLSGCGSLVLVGTVSAGSR